MVKNSNHTGKSCMGNFTLKAKYTMSLPTEKDNWRKASINGIDSMSPVKAKIYSHIKNWPR